MQPETPIETPCDADIDDFAHALAFDSWRERVCDPATPEHLVALLCTPVVPVAYDRTLPVRLLPVDLSLPPVSDRTCIACRQILPRSHFYAMSLRCRPCQHVHRHRECDTCHRDLHSKHYAGTATTCRDCKAAERRRGREATDALRRVVRDPAVARRQQRIAAEALERAAVRDALRHATGQDGVEQPVHPPREDGVRRGRHALRGVPAIPAPAGCTPFSREAVAHRRALIAKLAPDLSAEAIERATRRQHCRACGTMKLAAAFRPEYRVCDACIARDRALPAWERRYTARPPSPPAPPAPPPPSSTA